MSSSVNRNKRPTVFARPLLSDAPAEPGVYHSHHKLGDRWVYYALGHGCALLGCHHPSRHERDADVIAQLEELVDRPQGPSLALVRDDALITAALAPSCSPSFSRPQLVR